MKFNFLLTICLLFGSAQGYASPFLFKTVVYEKSVDIAIDFSKAKIGSNANTLIVPAQELFNVMALRPQKKNFDYMTEIVIQKPEDLETIRNYKEKTLTFKITLTRGEFGISGPDDGTVDGFVVLIEEAEAEFDLIKIFVTLEQSNLQSRS